MRAILPRRSANQEDRKTEYVQIEFDASTLEVIEDVEYCRNASE